ncbi:MAG: TetR/AcrR family transcriptional regulator [Allosphingosinicella sp.]
MGQPPPAPRRRRKEARPSEIVEAARATFVEHGFAATRVEEIARRAGVSKGTVYLYFPTKEALFEAVVRENVLPVLDRAATMLAADTETPAPVQLRFLLETMYRELVGTERKRLLHLIVAEGPRFPWLSEFYHREFVSRGMALLRTVIERGAARGELAPNGLDRFPKIIVAPAILAALYAILFGPHEPLDLDAYCEAHLQAVLKALDAAPAR